MPHSTLIEKTYLTNKARKAIETVELMGLDFVRGSQAHNPYLSYGLEHGLFDQEDMDAAQKRYEASCN